MGKEWLHEIKYDGYRMLCRVDHGQVQIWSRNRKEWTANFPTIANAVATLPIDTGWIDGEIVVTDGKGKSSFQALQNVLYGLPECCQPVDHAARRAFCRVWSPSVLESFFIFRPPD